MGISWFARCEQLCQFMDTAAGIAVGFLPGMRLQVHLHTLNCEYPIGIHDALLCSGKTLGTGPAAAPDSFVRFGTVLQRDSLDEHRAGRVTRRRVDRQV